MLMIGLILITGGLIALVIWIIARTLLAIWQVVGRAFTWIAGGALRLIILAIIVGVILLQVSSI